MYIFKVKSTFKICLGNTVYKIGSCELSCVVLQFQHHTHMYTNIRTHTPEWEKTRVGPKYSWGISNLALLDAHISWHSCMQARMRDEAFKKGKGVQQPSPRNWASNNQFKYLLFPARINAEIISATFLVFLIPSFSREIRK